MNSLTVSRFNGLLKAMNEVRDEYLKEAGECVAEGFRGWCRGVSDCSGVYAGRLRAILDEEEV